MKGETVKRGKGLLVAALLIQINIGSLYAWNIISSKLIDAHGFSAGIMGLVYGVTLLAFTGCMIPVGRLLHSFSPRKTILATLLLNVAGFLSTSFSNGNLAFVFIGHGLPTVSKTPGGFLIDNFITIEMD